MADSDPQSVPLPPVLADPLGPEITTNNRLFAAALSALIPGAGQILLGRRRKGSVMLIVFGLVIVGFWPLRLLRTDWGSIFLMWSMFGVIAVAAFQAFFIKETPGRRLPSRAWAFLLVVIVWVGLNIDLPAALLGSGFQAFEVSTSSMNDTLDLGDRFMVDRWYYRHAPPERGNLVVIRNQLLWSNG